MPPKFPGGELASDESDRSRRVLLALWIYVRVARRLRVLAADERARLVQTLQGHGLARGLAWWMP